MIDDLKPFELQAYYKRVLESGIDGLKGIEVVQAKQLRKFAESIQSSNVNLVHNLLIANPKYDYPARYKGGNEISYWESTITGYNEPEKVLVAIDQFLGTSVARKDTRFWLSSLWNEETQKTSDFKVLKNQIELQGHFVANGAKVYTTELAYILCTTDLSVKNLDTQFECSINGTEYIVSYLEGYKDGERYFDSTFGISTDTLYGAKGEQYVRDLHENYYHAEHETFMKGWRDVKRTYPSILNHQVVWKAGYYSGIVNKVDALVTKYSKVFQNFDKCDHEIAPTAPIKAQFQQPMNASVSSPNEQTERRIYAILRYLNQGQVRANPSLMESSLKNQFNFTSLDFDKAYSEIKKSNLIYFRDNSQFIAISRDGEIKYNELHTRYKTTRRKVLGGSLVIALAVISILFGDNLFWRTINYFNPKSVEELQNTTTPVRLDSAQQLHKDSIQLRLEYLTNLPILDRGIFIKYNFNDLVIGGVNVDTLRLGARTKLGENLRIEESNNELKLDITKEPYIEFEYKGLFYSLEILGKHYTFTAILRTNINLTLSLKNYSTKNGRVSSEK